MKLAFLGTGLAATLHTKTMKAVAPDVERWYASRDQKRAEETRAKFGGAGALAGYEAALDRSDIDVVLVALPPSMHLEWTLKALDAGKHVILEKPPLLQSRDFGEVNAAARRANRQVCVAENYFYKPLANRLRTVIAQGELGELKLIYLNAFKKQTTGDWRDDAALSVRGALFEGGIHWISFLANLGLTPARVHTSRAGSAEGLDRTTVTAMAFKEGVLATLAYSWEVGGLINGVRWSACYGTEGTLHFETNGIVAVQTGRRKRLTFPGLSDLVGYKAMLADFFEAIRHNRPPAYTLALAERDLRLVEEAYASIESH